MKIKVVAAIVDTRQLTLYREDGETIIIKQGDPRLRTILDEVTPWIVSQGFAEVEVKDISVVTGFQQFEEKSGVVRFFKVARQKLANLFTNEPVKQGAVGKVPLDPYYQQAKEAHRISVDFSESIDEIIAQAQPVSASDFNTSDLVQQGNIEEANGQTSRQRNEAEASHTVVAHVDGKLIPGMERIESHFTRAAKLGNTKGVENFLKRIASVIDERSHSIEDLLRFMERADMPIADDGSILIYKVLRKSGDHYVDCHTGNVPQKIGSYVCMDISLVDRHRNNECSNGLHVARRGFVSSFSGDVCTMAKLAPEDVVTVPSYDANKMRVMGYHILAELTGELYSLVKQNKPITTVNSGRVLLSDLLTGNHVARLEEVRITKQSGGGIVITPLLSATAVLKKVNAGRVARKAKPIPGAEALKNPESMKKDKPLNPKDVVKKVTSLSRKDQAQKLYQAFKKSPTKANKEKLLKFKKQVKLGWKALGIDDSEF